MRKSEADRLPHIVDFLDRLNFETRSRFKKSKTIPREAINWFDVQTASILSTLMSLVDDHGSTSIGVWRLSELSSVSHQSTRTRIDRLKLFGLVECSSEWDTNQTNRRTPTRITFHRHLRTALAKGCKAALMAEAVKFFATVAHKRLTDGGELSDAERESFDALATRTEAAKDAKKRETAEWRDNDRRFVFGAAKLWQFLQSYRGYGTQMPNWCGDNLAPTAARERRELTKLFQQYGGRITTLAWWTFVAGVPEIDEKTGKRKFLPESPHVQYVSDDKKPSHFAKHFNAILSDRSFIEWAKDWHNSRELLTQFFSGDVLDIQPRNGADDSELLGFHMGQSGTVLNEVHV